jgi:carbon monoxide dehydrogenase subunit G
MKVFPYFATPNTEIQTVTGSVELAAPPDDVWSVIGQFNLQWHPAVARARLIGEGLGQIRRLQTRDGKEIVERLADVDDAKRSYRYTLISGVPASHYAGVIDVKPKANGSVAEWRIEFLAQSDIVVRTMVSRLIETGLGSLKARFGAPHDDARRA